MQQTKNETPSNEGGDILYQEITLDGNELKKEQIQSNGF